MLGERSDIVEAEPGRRGLWTSVVVLRWTTLALMAAIAVFVDIVRPAGALGMFAALTAWNAVFTLRRWWERRAARWIDLALSAGVLLAAPLLVQAGSLERFPFLGAAYPLATVMTWAAAGGVPSGLFAAAVLSVPLVLSRPLNSLSYRELPAGDILSVATGCVYYALGAFILGRFAESIDRAGSDIRAANERVLVARERAARLEERDALARALHDSILQTLALVQRRIRDLSARDDSAASDLSELGEIVGREERDLRSLLRRGIDEAPEGFVSLRTVLEAAAFGIHGVPVEISTVEPAWIPANDTAEVSAAVRQGVENAAQHARAGRVTLFGEESNSEVLISVLDDGAGFEYDESRLEADGRLGISKSMKGRIERLGGHMSITTSPGRGTKVEFRLPAVR